MQGGFIISDIDYGIYLKTNKLLKITLFFNYLGTSLVNSMFVVFLTTVKDFSASGVSTIVGLTPLLVLPFIFLWGRLVDESKTLIKFLILTHACNGIINICLVFIDNYFLFFALYLIKAFIILPTGSMSDEYLLFLVTKAGLPFGQTRIFATIGYAFAGILGPGITYFFGPSGCIVVGGVMLLFSVILFSKMPELVLEDKLKNTLNPENIPRPKVSKLFRNKNYLYILFSAICVLSVSSAATSFGSQSIFLGMDAPTTIIATLPFITVVLEVFAIRFMDFFQTQNRKFFFFFIAAVLSAVRWGAMMFAGSYKTVLMLSTLHGVISGIVIYVQNPLIRDSVDDNQKSTAFLMVSVIVYNIVPSVLNLITGELVPSFGVVIFSVIYFFVTIPASFITWRCMKKEKNLVLGS